jgi:molybdate transport system substrate-binding protein
MKLKLLPGSSVWRLAARPGGNRACPTQNVPVVRRIHWQFALAEVAAAFTQETEREVTLTFGSSGNFFRQIRKMGHSNVLVGRRAVGVRPGRKGLHR